MVLAVVDDLLFRSKIRSAGNAAGKEIVFVSAGGAVAATVRDRRPSLVIVDLDGRGADAVGVIRSIRAECGAEPPIVGFGAHVNVDRLAAARAAGCDQALARSAFVTSLPSLLAGAAAGAD
jgi:DNA-binding response OmpR family regulator